LIPFVIWKLSRMSLEKKDEETVVKYLENMEGVGKRAGHKDLAKKEELDFARKLDHYVREEKKEVRFGDWNAKEIDWLNELMLLTAKPVIYLINLSEKDYFQKKNKWLLKIKNWIEARNPDPIIPFSCALEAQLVGMSEDEQKAHLAEVKTTSAIPKIVKMGYSALQLIYFFTAGTDEVKCWTIRNGTRAPQAAGVIHTDFMNGFICAEVMKFEDYREAGSEAGVKAAGKYTQQGKNYVVVDGDIILFKFNSGGGLKKK